MDDQLRFLINNMLTSIKTTSRTSFSKTRAYKFSIKNKLAPT